MPKMKIKSGAKKRFRDDRERPRQDRRCTKRHRLLSHDADYIRSHRGTKILKKGDEKSRSSSTCRTTAKEIADEPR